MKLTSMMIDLICVAAVSLKSIHITYQATTTSLATQETHVYMSTATFLGIHRHHTCL